MKSLRKALLRELFLRSRGSLKVCLSVSELPDTMNLANAMAARGNRFDAADSLAKRAAEQLEAKGWVAIDPNEPTIGLRITMPGIEEAEKAMEPVHQRWPREHPIFFGVLMSIVTGMAIFFLQSLFKSKPEPPVVNVIVPEKR